MKALLPLLLLVAACGAPTPAERAFDEAEAIAHRPDQKRVRDLYRAAAKSDPDPLRREKAAVRAAHLEWRVFRNAAAARELLAPLGTVDAHLERARMAAELEKNYAAARAAVARARAAAKSSHDRRRTVLAGAFIDVRERNPASLPAAIAAIESVIEASGPRVETAKLLLEAAILAGDDAAALRALRWYYADVPQLVPASVPDRRALGRALADARLYQHAAMILTDDRELVAYAATLRRIEALVDDYYRGVAGGNARYRAFRQSLEKEIPKDAERRFGVVYTMGETDGVPGMHYGHRVVDARRSVEQYGRTGTLRFILLDNMIANGFAAWIFENRSGAGGWNRQSTVYQVRPMYANAPVNAWMSLTDPEERARDDAEIASETRRDAERIRGARVTALRGLELRMERQGLEALKRDVERQGLTGDALRDAFIARYRTEEFQHSIWAHEGRHAIDQTQFGIDDSEELEYRAKLSEVAFSGAPRLAMAGPILSPVGGGTAHGEANRRLLEGMLRVTGLRDLTKLDTLTDEELRAAARKLDPLAVRR